MQNLATYHDWLLQVTDLPTAAGREHHVINWVEQWLKHRPHLTATRDHAGNITISRKSVPPHRPLYFTAHMDHPGFVVSRQTGPHEIHAHFRGGVRREYFTNTPVLLIQNHAEPVPGVVGDFYEGQPEPIETKRADPTVIIRFQQEVHASTGDLIVWDVGPARIENDRLHTRACDDLAGLVAALAACDELLANDDLPPDADIRLLLTRAEEVGFIGAIAACKLNTVPHDARLICLENSKSFAESPIGGGPIVRVGDRTSTFDPELTYTLSKIAQQLAGEDENFLTQRKLMDGGTCEASAFQSFGHTATCLCLPLGNYHNMDEATGKIASEHISLQDFQGLIRLLVAIGLKIDDPAASPPLRNRLNDLYESEKHVLQNPTLPSEPRP